MQQSETTARTSSRYERFILRHWLNILAGMLVASVLFNFYAILILGHWTPFDEGNILAYSKQWQLRIVKPNLRRAVVTIPGRPHPLPFQRENPDFIKAIRKRCRFTCSTDGRGFRRLGGPAVASSPLIACVGASITFGLGVEDNQTYPAALSALLNEAEGQAPRCTVLNAGVPGHKTWEMRRLLDDVVLPLGPAVVIINPEYNNISEYGPHLDRVHFRQKLEPGHYAKLQEVYVGDLKGMIDSCRRRGAQVILMGSPFNSFFPFQDAALVYDVGSIAAHDAGIPFVDARYLLLEDERRYGLTLTRAGDVQAVEQGVGGRREVVFKTVYPWKNDRQHVSADVYAFLDLPTTAGQHIFIDGSHPLPEGHRLIAEHLLREVLPLLGVVRRPAGQLRDPKQGRER